MCFHGLKLHVILVNILFDMFWKLFKKQVFTYLFMVIYFDLCTYSAHGIAVKYN